MQSNKLFKKIYPLCDILLMCILEKACKTLNSLWKEGQEPTATERQSWKGGILPPNLGHTVISKTNL